VTAELANTETLTADLAILSVGVRPDTTLARQAGLAVGPRGGIHVDAHMRTSDPDVFAAGDAVEVADTVTGEPMLIPLAGPANRQGRVAAENICGRDTTYKSTQGTAIVKVFDMTAGGTGASEKMLKRLGRPFLKAYLHPSDHAGYYPGSTPLNIKVVFAPDTGNLLGAQVMGYEGVDKRLDVFATAIRAGMTVQDLENLELAYAPPYGSAKDPVNMAGFVAANLLKGDVQFWYPDDYPSKTAGGTILDVRGPQEYDTWHIPGAVNIPLGKLRGQLNQIPRDKPLFVYCKVGFRSYLAYRLLKQHGFDPLATLAGGTLTFCSFHDTTTSASQPEKPFLPYAEEKTAAKAAPTGKVTEVDCCGLQCPGPIQRLKETMDKLAAGDEVKVCASDPGFATDLPAWCRKQGHEVLALQQAGPRTEARVRKGTPAPHANQTGAMEPVKDKKTMVVFSGDLDKVLAAFVIANGAVSMGSPVSMFFTFWGINALRKDAPQARGKGLLDRMFGGMMPKGPDKLKLSNMNMFGMGTAMMKHVMEQKNVVSLPSLIAAARQAGVKLIACTMSMDVMGIRREELVEGIEFGGVAAFLGEADQSNVTLFI
jgi:peroxiredoxin family protein/rhodanese-related sulfurtransferase/TusA-related sulfurtransferase